MDPKQEPDTLLLRALMASNPLNEACVSPRRTL